MAKILVTGAKGFIGENAYNYFYQKGYEVVSTVTDIKNKNSLAPLFKEVDYVIHAAGKVKKGIPNWQEYYSTNVLGTRNVCMLCLQNNSKLINLGSAATATGGDLTVRLYIKSKEESQRLVEQYCHLYSLRAVTLKLGVIYNKANDTGRPGARYPIEKLLADIENIIRTHNFDKYKLVDYSNIRV